MLDTANSLIHWVKCVSNLPTHRSDQSMKIQMVAYNCSLGISWIWRISANLGRSLIKVQKNCGTPPKLCNCPKTAQIANDSIYTWENQDWNSLFSPDEIRWSYNTSPIPLSTASNDAITQWYLEGRYVMNWIHKIIWWSLLPGTDLRHNIYKSITSKSIAHFSIHSTFSIFNKKICFPQQNSSARSCW